MWIHGGSALLEFPPTLAGQRIFQLGDDGVLRAIETRNGHTLWQRRLGFQSASTPAAVGGVVYATVLERSPGVEAGAIVAVDAATGRPLWSHDLPSPSESSPMVDGGRVFFGTQDGTVYALDAHDGSVVWTYHAEGAVKASPTLANGVLYFGDYSGHVQAISERTAGGCGTRPPKARCWAAARSTRPRQSCTDGCSWQHRRARLCLRRCSGHLDWAVQTGAYVYSFPAVTNAPGWSTITLALQRHVLCLERPLRPDRWRDEEGGASLDRPTIIGRVVYFAALGTHHPTGWASRRQGSC